MGSLKDALQKAGFKPSKQENERPKLPKKERKVIEKHQEHRNFCEICNAVCPDVELYKHNIQTIDAQWICIRCADRNSIPDSTRRTNQSECAQKRMFRREFT